MNRSRTRSLAASLLVALAACGEVVTGGPPDDGENQTPVATPAQLATYMSTPVEGQLAGQDADGDPLVYSIASDPAGGALELADDGRFRYTPEPGRSGTDAFSFEVDDGQATSEQATVDITIATLTDGTPDATFGQGGAVRTDFGETDALSGVVVGQNGRVVTVGNTASSLALVAGYSARGGLVTSFGEAGNGTTTLNPGAGYDGLGDVVQQAGGRLVAVGQSQAGDRDFILVGMDADGHLDSSFGGGGVTLTDVGDGTDDVARSVAILSDGRLVVAGYANNGTDDDFAVARYSADGVIDETFGGGGSTLVDLGGVDRAADVAIDGAGNIVLVGEAGDDMGVARLLPDGEPDSSFGDDGVVRVDRGEYDEAVGVAFGADGALYVGGGTQAGDQWSMAAVRLTPSGDLDPAFGDGGWALAGSASANTYAMDMLLLPNQTLLLVGGWTEGAVTEAAAARLDLSGRLDPAFGAAGIYHQAIGSDGNDTLFAAALQEDGKVVAAGWSRNADLDGLVIRLGW